MMNNVKQQDTIQVAFFSKECWLFYTPVLWIFFANENDPDVLLIPLFLIIFAGLNR